MLLAIVALATALRAYHLGVQEPVVRRGDLCPRGSMGGLFGPYGLASISHPPGYLFIMRLMGSISHEEWLLRLPALIASVLGIVAAWGLGRALVGRVEGLLVAFMLALSALHLEYAQEAHSYALFGTLSTFLLWSLYWVAQRSVGQFAKLPSDGKLRTIGPWAVVVLLATADLYVHYYALAPVGLSLIVFPCFLLAVQPGPVASLWREPAKRRALLHLAIALVVVGLLFLPQLSSQLLGSARVAADRTEALEAGILAASFDFKSVAVRRNVAGPHHQSHAMDRRPAVRPDGGRPVAGRADLAGVATTRSQRGDVGLDAAASCRLSPGLPSAPALASRRDA